MNRRQFVSRVSLGAAAACTTIATPSLAAPAGRVNIRFVGMMGFIERADESLLVATPGHQASSHLGHIPFLMTRAGTPMAKALGFAPVAGVVPSAFDTALIGTQPQEFVFRSLGNTSLDVVAGTQDRVTNEASQLAQMNQIAPGKRVRGNIEKWASSTVSLRGGRLENSAAHPDAGKVWSFGSYRQRLTDCVNFKNAFGEPTTIRLTGATDARTFRPSSGESVDLWVFSAAMMEARGGDPTKIEHSELMFDYLVDATPLAAECPEATGREVPTTELPYVNPSSASMGVVAGERRLPPDSIFCWMAAFLLDIVKKS